MGLLYYHLRSVKKTTPSIQLDVLLFGTLPLVVSSSLGYGIDCGCDIPFLLLYMDT